jgi:hypothetical protein
MVDTTNVPCYNLLFFCFWAFCMVCEVNLPAFQKSLWVPSSLVMSKNVNNQSSGLLPYIGVVWAIGGACDVRSTDTTMM